MTRSNKRKQFAREMVKERERQRKITKKSMDGHLQKMREILRPLD
jgi:hypothetical protein